VNLRAPNARRTRLQDLEIVPRSYLDADFLGGPIAPTNPIPLGPTRRVELQNVEPSGVEPELTPALP